MAYMCICLVRSSWGCPVPEVCCALGAGSRSKFCSWVAHNPWGKSQSLNECIDVLEYQPSCFLLYLLAVAFPQGIHAVLEGNRPESIRNSKWVFRFFFNFHNGFLILKSMVWRESPRAAWRMAWMTGSDLGVHVEHSSLNTISLCRQSCSVHRLG